MWARHGGPWSQRDLGLVRYERAESLEGLLQVTVGFQQWIRVCLESPFLYHTERNRSLFTQYSTNTDWLPHVHKSKARYLQLQTPKDWLQIDPPEYLTDAARHHSPNGLEVFPVGRITCGKARHHTQHGREPVRRAQGRDFLCVHTPTWHTVQTVQREHCQKLSFLCPSGAATYWLPFSQREKPSLYDFLDVMYIL